MGTALVLMGKIICTPLIEDVHPRDNAHDNSKTASERVNWSYTMNVHRGHALPMVVCLPAKWRQVHYL